MGIVYPLNMLQIELVQSLSHFLEICKLETPFSWNWSSLDSIIFIVILFYSEWLSIDISDLCNFSYLGDIVNDLLEQFLF